MMIHNVRNKINGTILAKFAVIDDAEKYFSVIVEACKVLNRENEYEIVSDFISIRDWLTTNS